MSATTVAIPENSSTGTPSCAHHTKSSFSAPRPPPPRAARIPLAHRTAPAARAFAHRAPLRAPRSFARTAPLCAPHALHRPHQPCRVAITQAAAVTAPRRPRHAMPRLRPPACTAPQSREPRPRCDHAARAATTLPALRRRCPRCDTLPALRHAARAATRCPRCDTLPALRHAARAATTQAAPPTAPCGRDRAASRASRDPQSLLPRRNHDDRATSHRFQSFADRNRIVGNLRRRPRSLRPCDGL